MKHFLLPIAAGLLFVACDGRVATAPPVVEKNTTIINPPAKEEKKVENNITIINPPANNAGHGARALVRANC